MRSPRLTSSLVACLVLLPALGHGQDAAKDDPAKKEAVSSAEQQLAEARLKFMKGALGRYEIFIGQDPTPAPLLPSPALRWSNPVSGVKDGMVGVFTTGGRPTAVVQFTFHSKDFQVHEFYSVTSEDFEMKRGDRSVWKPAKAVFAFQELKDGPAPAKTDKLRLPQMRKIAAEFSVIDDFGSEKKEKHNLRLMAQPLHRYTDEARGVVDGAVFAYALGTDPEAIVLLEVVKEKDALKWQFGFSPMSIYALAAKRNDKEVWTIGERAIFNSYDTPFRVGPYPRAPDETIPD